MFQADHPSFVNQPENAATVWRYMDLPRYVSMLAAEALHFARADQMDDQWEGAFGAANRQRRPEIYGEHYASMIQVFPQLRAMNRLHTHLNCWHLSEVESAAMWSIYQREGRGVAVRSTWGTLTMSLNSENQVFGAKVRYVDYNSTFIPEGNAFDAYLFKRESFAHEQEVRLVMSTGHFAENPEDPSTNLNLGPEEPVIPVTVDLERMISAVYVAPDAPNWIADVVADVTTRYGLGCEVRQSDLASDPVD